jgi:hypothetical protein
MYTTISTIKPIDPFILANAFIHINAVLYHWQPSDRVPSSVVWCWYALLLQYPNTCPTFAFGVFEAVTRHGPDLLSVLAENRLYEAPIRDREVLALFHCSLRPTKRVTLANTHGIRNQVRVSWHSGIERSEEELESH